MVPSPLAHGASILGQRAGLRAVDGSLAQPYQTVRQGAAALDNCPAVLAIQAGDYPEGSLTIKASVKMEARNGLVHIH